MSKPVKIKEEFYFSIKKTLEKARYKAYRSVNSVMVEAYWNVGRQIVEEEQDGKTKAKYGDALIKELAKRLTNELGKGFNERNLRYFRSFYLSFPKWNTLCSELSWSHYRLLIRVKSESAKQYYLQEAKEQNWSVRALERQIQSFYYERLIASDNKSLVQKEAKENTNLLKPSPQDLIKDPYVLEFLNLPENPNYLEKDLEKALIDQMQKFLLELGKGFAFVGRQYRVSTEITHFYIDLVFYNYILKCFVLIDLKKGKLIHQDIGQMDMYVRMFEDLVKPKGDNPTVGLILCAEKEESVVKYSVLNESKQIFASKYQTVLPTEEELKKELGLEQERIESKNS